MPQVFKIGSYWIYFWTNENRPLEPVHVHISEGKPVQIFVDQPLMEFDDVVGAAG